nr:hypothetical protein [Tanacetum cinerariifolium]
MARMIHVRDVVLRNSLLTGYLQTGSCWKRVDVFMSIRREDVKIDATTFLCRLKDYRLGVQVHGLIVRMGFLNDVVAGSVTVDMYAKCRKLEESVSTCAAIKSYTGGVQLHWLTIKCMLQSNVYVENAILDMYGKCGALAEARSMFEEMQIKDVVSWNAIIAAVLKACAGLQSLKDGSSW